MKEDVTSETYKLREARENHGDQAAINLSLASHWLRMWRASSKPIVERGEAKPKHSWITQTLAQKNALTPRTKIILRQI